MNIVKNTTSTVYLYIQTVGLYQFIQYNLKGLKYFPTEFNMFINHELN